MIYRVTYALLSTAYRGSAKTFLPDFSMFSAVFCFISVLLHFAISHNIITFKNKIAIIFKISITSTIKIKRI
jgi:hypothetical protein